MENGVPIEYGPSIHGIGEQNFLYYRSRQRAHRVEHRGLSRLRARLGAEHLEAVPGLQQHLSERCDADVDDRIVPAG